MESPSLLLEGLPEDLELVKSKVELYFRNKRRSGGEIVRIREHEEDKRKAFLIYLNEEDLKKVLDKKIHKVDFKRHGSVDLTVKTPEETKLSKTRPALLPKPENSVPLRSTAEPVGPAAQPTEEEKDAADDDSAIPDLRISSPQSLDKETLQMYFEQFTERFELAKHGNDSWILKLYSRSDVEKIVGREEPALGIRVEVIRAGASGVDWDPRRFILTGFDGATERSRISLFIGSCSTTTQHAWEPLDDSAVAVTFTHHIDVPSFMRKVSSKQLRGRDIGVTRVERTDAVLIQGELEPVGEDALTLYFSNRKRSGGGEIRSFIWINRRRSAVLSFGSADDAEAVVEQQQHSVCGSDVHTSLFYSSLQKVLTGETPSLSDAVTQVTVPVHEDLLRFLQSHEHSRAELESVCARVHAVLTLGAAGLTLDLDVDVNSLAALLIAPGWESRSAGEIRAFLSRFHTEELSAEPRVWSRAQRDGLHTAVTAAVSYTHSGSTLLISGLTEEVKALADGMGAQLRNAAALLETERNTLEAEVQLENTEAFELIQELTRTQLTLGELKVWLDEDRRVVCLRGLKESVCSAETLLRRTQESLVSQPLTLSSDLSRFLTSLGPGRFEREHFLPERIPARLLTRTDSVAILAEKENLKRAEDKIREILQEQVIPLPPGQTDEAWTLFLRSLQADPGVRITQSGTQLLICGLAGAVSSAAAAVRRCLQTRAPASESVPLRSEREAEFVESCLRLSDLPELKTLGATALVCRTGASPCVRVTADRQRVREAVSVVQKLLSTITVETHKYSKAGEAKVLEKHEASLKTKAKELRCSVYFSPEPPAQTPTADVHSPAPPNTSRPGPVQSLNLKHGSDRKVVINGVPIFLKKGDITKETADVIVNSTNKSLDLDTGVCGAILKAAGKSVVDECKKHAPLKAGAVLLTGAGDLPCRTIAQMVGPDSIADVTASLGKVLSLCEGRKASSLAVPAIGTGRGGFEPRDSIRAMLAALQTHLTENSCTSLRSVSVLAFEQNTFLCFRESFRRWNTPKHGKMPENQVKLRGVRVELKRGNITTETVRGIVNSTNRDMSLRTGVSGAVFAAAGATVEQESQKHGPLQGDEPAVTGAGRLQCDAIIHMLGPHTALEVRSRVKKVLERCETGQITTVSFPAVGTGGGGVAAADSIAAMLQGFEDHLSVNAPSVLRLIYIVSERDDVLQELQTGLGTWTANTQDSEEDEDEEEDEEEDWSWSSDEEADASDAVEVKMGRVRVRVSRGDILRETSHAIVNSTNTSLNLSSGVSGAILKASGAAVANECKKNAPQPADGVVLTGAGDLKNVKHIIHMVGPTSVTGIGDSTYRVLQMCEEKRIESVSFPALGTGAGHMGSAAVADAMTGALKIFVQDGPKHLKRVHILILQPKLLPDFQEAVQKCRTSPPTAPPGRAKLSPPSAQSPCVSLEQQAAAVSFPAVSVELYGASGSSVSALRRVVERLLEDECETKHIESGLIAGLPEHHQTDVVRLSAREQVRVSVGPGRLSLSGRREDVLRAALEIGGVLQELRDRESRDAEVRRLQETLSWEVLRGERWLPLEPQISYELEIAFHRRDKSLQVQRSGQTLTADLTHMSLSARGRTRRIRRRLRADADTAVIHPPPTWTQMSGRDLEVVTLLSDSEEYRKVLEEFVRSSFHTSVPRVRVQQIERVQSRSQWQRYCVLKQAVDKRRPTQSNERRLYHGTTRAISAKINQSGFNRSFCGRNAVAHGEGTYFAREAWYSCQDQYSTPDADGLKCVYRARVVTGSPCASRPGMKEPDPLGADPRDGLHDCAVDSLAQPFIYVVFCDAGAYPEYLITFRTT